MAETITLDPAVLGKYVNDATPASEYVKECAAEAAAMMAGHLSPENVRSVPPPHVITRALLEVGAELYHRRTTRNGVVGLEGGPDNFAPLRIARDPMKACYEILRPYMKAAIA